MRYVNLKDKAYQLIKGRIISGEYAPGQPLDEKAIIKELSISRTPFREAINALSKEDLVDIYPNRGMFVRAITIEDISQVFDIRMILEPYMIRLVCGNMPEEVIDELDERQQDADHMDEDAVLEEDDYFHQTILKYVKNSHLIKIMQNLYDCNRMRIIFTRQTLSSRRALTEHREILAAVRRNDPDEAARLMEDHILHSKNRAVNALL